MLNDGAAGDLYRQRQGRRDRRTGHRPFSVGRDHGLPGDAGAAAQSGEGLERQGHRPHRSDPGNLRPARAHARKARCRSNWPISITRRRGWCGPGRISSASAAASAFSAAPAKPSSRPTAASSRTAFSRIEEELEKVKRTRKLHRDSRKRVPYPIVALVGYTNAGKSTLFNRMTAASVLSADMLFATLDPTLRAIDLPHGNRIILSDTVGFISDLPTGLVAAFRATLEEVIEADVILHVRDMSHEDSGAQSRDVEQVLGELGIEATDPRLIEVWNKIDRLDAEGRDRLDNLAERQPAERRPLTVSALSGEGIDDAGRRDRGQAGRAPRDHRAVARSVRRRGPELALSQLRSALARHGRRRPPCRHRPRRRRQGRASTSAVPGLSRSVTPRRASAQDTCRA